MKEAKAVVAKQEGQDALIQRLFNLIKENLRKLNIPDEHKVYFLIELDMQFSAVGKMDCLTKKNIAFINPSTYSDIKIDLCDS